MALDYTTLTALINKKYLPILYNQIFTANHYMLAKLKQKAKTYNERKIVVPLEYAKSTVIAFMARYDTIGLRPEEIATAAEYEPKMLTGSLTVCIEDELDNKSDQSIKNILTTKMKNLQRSIQESLATHIWTRGDTYPGGASAAATAKNWNTIDYLVNKVSATVGGIAVVEDTTNAWWQSKMLSVDVAGGFSDDATLEADLIDPSKDVYLPTLLQRGVAKAKYLTGEVPNMIVLPQYLWDLLERVYDSRKLGSTMVEMVGNIGFNTLQFRKRIPIVADDDMVVAQTGDTDGRIYFLNDNYMYMYFNSGAKFKATDFARPANQNARSCLVNAYGNIAISNRAAQAVLTGLKSPQAYAT